MGGSSSTVGKGFCKVTDGQRSERGEYLESLPGRGSKPAEAGTWGAESHPEAAAARRGAEIDCGATSPRPPRKAV